MNHIREAYTTFVELYDEYKALNNSEEYNDYTYKIGLYNDMMELYNDTLFDELTSGTTLTEEEQNDIYTKYENITEGEGEEEEEENENENENEIEMIVETRPPGNEPAIGGARKRKSKKAKKAKKSKKTKKSKKAKKTRRNRR